MNYIIESVKFVVDNAEHVIIDEEAIFNFSKKYQPQESKLNQSSIFSKKEFSQEEELAFSFVFSSISFSTWGDPKWSVEYQDNKITNGSCAITASLYRALDDGIHILDPKILSSLTLDQVKHFFRGENELSLITQRHQNLVELGTVIVDKFDGSFLKFVEKSRYDVEKLLHSLVSQFSFFRDESKYHGEKVYFYNLAQLLINDIMRIFPEKKFKHTQHLTALANYRIPYILHSFGILKYDPLLTQTLYQKKELNPNSFEEIEIRAATIMAVNLIYFVLKNKFPEISLTQVNDFLWLASNEVPKDSLPHHRTRSMYY